MACRSWVSSALLAALLLCAPLTAQERRIQLTEEGSKGFMLFCERKLQYTYPTMQQALEAMLVSIKMGASECRVVHAYVLVGRVK